MAKISERLRQVNNNIAQACEKAGRDRHEVKLVVVTKSAQFDDVTKVLKLGYTDLGENRVQHLKKVVNQMNDFFSRSQTSQPDIHWHVIGHLQRNKVRHILQITSMIHSVDTLRLAEEINTQAAKMNLKCRVLLQVNTSQEPQKYGVPVGAAVHLVEQMAELSGLELCGLMTMAPLTKNESVIRSCFARARELFEEMRGEKIVGTAFQQLSMGMSNDYEIAVEEGATLLRIGSAIFAGP